MENETLYWVGLSNERRANDRETSCSTSFVLAGEKFEFTGVSFLVGLKTEVVCLDLVMDLTISQPLQLQARRNLAHCNIDNEFTY